MVDLVQWQETLGLASGAVQLTGSAASVVSQIKELFTKDGSVNDSEAQRLLADLAAQLTSANMMNLQLSTMLRAFHADLEQENDFKAQKAKYVLINTSYGDPVLQLREESRENGEPLHYACPVCANKDKLISYLGGGKYHRQCQSCRLVIKFTDQPRTRSSNISGVY